MTYIVTGGLGYLGFALVNDLLRRSNEQIIVIDSESPGEFFHRNPRIKVHQGDISDREFLGSIQLPSDTKGAFHLAAKKSVSESLLKPNEYMKVNLEGTKNILDFCQENGVENFVFTSSAAVYRGIEDLPSIDESSDLDPSSPYGVSKLMAENEIKNFSQVHGLRSAILRVFNIGGSIGGWTPIKPEENLIPILIHCILTDQAFTVFGQDLQTKDGSCERDFIHVSDVSDAHIKAMKKLEGDNTQDCKIYNICSGNGSSVFEILNLLEEASGEVVQRILQPIRVGEYQKVIGNNENAKQDLGWSIEKTLQDIVMDSWNNRGSKASIIS